MKLFEKDDIFLNEDGQFEFIIDVEFKDGEICLRNMADLNTVLSEDGLKKFLNELYLIHHTYFKREEFLMNFIEHYCPHEAYEHVSKVLMDMDSEKRKYMGDLE